MHQKAPEDQLHVYPKPLLLATEHIVERVACRRNLRVHPHRILPVGKPMLPAFEGQLQQRTPMA